MQLTRQASLGTLHKLAGTLVLIPILGCAQPGHTQVLSPYSDFEALSVADMDSVRVKLTYGGPQDQPVMTLALTGTTTEVPIGAFVPFRRSGFDYSNETVGVLKTGASREDLKAIITNVGTLPRVTDGGVDPGGRLSFALLSTTGGTTKVFESIVNDTTGGQLFSQMLAAVSGNQSGSRRLLSLGCAVSMLPTGVPASAEGQAVVHLTGLRQDRHVKGQFVGKVIVTNQSASTLASPLTLVVIRKSGNAVLIQEDGFTCNIEPRGASFVNLAVGAGLGPNASVQRELRFDNPSQMKFDLTFRVFAGSGTR